MPEQPDDRNRQMGIRGLSLETRELLKSRAHARGWSVAQYIEALMKLHSLLMDDAQSYKTERAVHASNVLEDVGLEAVRA